jgi:glycosyltransferase involved in cell wall biosynthesis
MKIIHVNLSRSYRGGEHQTIELIKELKKRGLQQEIVCRRNVLFQRDLNKIENVKIAEVSGPFGGHIGRGSTATRKVIIHAHDGRAVYWAWIENLIRGTPYIITRRVINPIGNSWLTLIAYKTASTLTAVSRYAAEILEFSVKNKVRVIYDGCREFCDSESDSVEPLLEDNFPIIGHVGAFDESVKGQGILIEAFLLLLNDYPKAKLYLIGDGKDLNFFREKYKNQTSIVFTGSVNNVKKWLSTFNLFCFPSRIEALGSSVLEAMTLRIPVIVSNAGGLPELIGKNERGIVVETPSAERWFFEIRNAIENSVETENRALRAKAFVDKITTKNMAEKYLDVYNNIFISEEA